MTQDDPKTSRSESDPAPASPVSVDVGIITIREDEFRAALHYFRPDRIIPGARQYNIGELETSSGGIYTVALVRCPEPGTGEAQEVARDLIEELRPRWIVVVGIAGGVPDADFTLGDVVVSTRIQDFNVSAVLAGGDREFSLSGGPIDRAASAIVANIAAIESKLGEWNSDDNIGLPRPEVSYEDDTRYYGDAQWNAKVMESLKKGFGTARRPLVTTGEVASSDTLIKDPDLIRIMQRAARKIVAVEMESAGVYRAARDKVPAFAIRGISDVVGLKRDDAMTKYACRTAAAFCHAFLRTEPIGARARARELAPVTDPEESRPASVDRIEAAFRLACRNIGRYGDTDIFPYPPENLALRDCEDYAVAELLRLHESFATALKAVPPTHHSTLTQVGYTGFRWATQLDPLWNAYLLGLMIVIGPELEAARLPVDDEVVYSYRFGPDANDANLFGRDVGWVPFQRRSLELSKAHAWALKCDIADFYQRVPHTHLVQAISALPSGMDVAWRVQRILDDFTGGTPVGIPVGGPAARMLSELLLNKVDHILQGRGIPFCRYCDDFHMFSDSPEGVYEQLVFLSDLLQRDFGLSLQKLKTRIMRSGEFSRSLEALILDDSEGEEQRLDAGAFLRMRLRFDPYSATAVEDYERLASQVERFDILGMLSRELSKSRIHDALVRRLVNALLFLSGDIRDATVSTLIENLQTLTPVLPTVLIVLRKVFPDISTTLQDRILDVLCDSIENRTPSICLDANLGYALRVIAMKSTPRTRRVCGALFGGSHSQLIGRDVILVKANWRDVHWLSSLKQRHRELRPWERRALILASFGLAEEGRQWREERVGELDPTERLLIEWANRADLVSHRFGLV